jgi:hypothetical protein
MNMGRAGVLLKTPPSENGEAVFCIFLQAGAN